MYDVALSFAGEDRPYVKTVAELLKSRGINVFYDDFDQVNLWGKNLVDHLGEVYAKQSRFVVMFISKHYAEKNWTNHERKFAQERAFNLKEDCILPARFDNTEVPGLSSTIGYIDLSQKTPEELVELIAAKINEEPNQFIQHHSAEEIIEQNDDEAEDYDESGDQDEDNILYSGTCAIKPNIHRLFTFTLDQHETIEYKIESKDSVDIMVFSGKDYKIWNEQGDIDTYYEHFKDCLSVENSFTAPKNKEYMIVVVNYGETKTKIQVDIRRLND